MMRRAFGGLLAALLALLAVAGPGGCGGGGSSKPNPELKEPNVPPSERGKGGGARLPK